MFLVLNMCKSDNLSYFCYGLQLVLILPLRIGTFYIYSGRLIGALSTFDAVLGYGVTCFAMLLVAAVFCTVLLYNIEGFCF